MNTLDDIFTFPPKVYNIKTDKNIPQEAINIMRPSKWGNPYKLSDYNDRDVVLELYSEYIFKRIQLEPNLLNEIKQELGGKDLVCCCHPKKCHGHILLKIANE
jgi:hypothetical protein